MSWDSLLRHRFAYQAYYYAVCALNVSTTGQFIFTFHTCNAINSLWAGMRFLIRLELKRYVICLFKLCNKTGRFFIKINNFQTYDYSYLPSIRHDNPVGCKCPFCYHKFRQLRNDKSVCSQHQTYRYCKLNVT